MMHCNRCGGILQENAEFCPHCGNAVVPIAACPNYVNPYVAFMGYGMAPQVTIQYNGDPAEQTGYERYPGHEEVVSIKGLWKRYSRKADWAVSNVSFTCYEGEIVGLLGHNGAGKSTTLKCLEGMLPFDKGEIKIAGYDIQKDGEKAKAHMGFVTDNHATFVKMTGLQYINFMADVYEVPSKVRVKRLAELERVFQLGRPIENLISSYSHGMRQKICMMGSLIHQPKLWILDEPMTGLDPRTMHAVQEFMHQYVAQGNSIIFSSHALNTVAKLCDRVVLIRKGQQVDELNVKEIYAANPNFDFEEYFLRNEKQS